jgi:hypothetical protein
MKLSFLTVLLLLVFLVNGQEKMDREQFLRDSAKIMRPKLVRPQFKLDNRLTFFEGQSLVINGLDAGVLLKDKLRLTVGYYELNDDLNALKHTRDSLDFRGLIHVSYASINTEFIYKNTRFFSLGMPLEIGAGETVLRYKNMATEEIGSTERGLIAMSHFGLSATFKPIRWFGLKAIAGYRKTLFNKVKDFNFDGVFTSLGFNVDVREIIKDIRMIRLQKRYRRGNTVSNAVDIITD